MPGGTRKDSRRVFEVAQQAPELLPINLNFCLRMKFCLCMYSIRPHSIVVLAHPYRSS